MKKIEKTIKPTVNQLRDCDLICRRYIEDGELKTAPTYNHIRSAYMSGYDFKDSGHAYSGSVSDYNTYVAGVGTKYDDWEIAKVILDKIRSEVFGLPTSYRIVDILGIKDKEIPRP